MRISLSRASALGLSIISIITLLAPSAASAVGLRVMINGKALVFSDVQETAWFSTYVRQAAEAGIVSGYKDARGNLTGKFGPANSITIAEALKVAVEGAGYDEELYSSLVDGSTGSPQAAGKVHWANAYFSVAKSEQFDFLKEQARVDRPATRGEVISMFASAFGVDMSTAMTVDSRYTDVKSSTMFAQAIEALSRDDIVAGDTDIQGQATGTFRPNASINRAEVAKMVVNARAKYGSPGQGRKPTEAQSTVVSYTSAGFSPAVLRVKLGDTVTFHNDSGENLRVASDPHPTHTGLAGFDAVTAFGQGENYVYTFTHLGTFGYHNHLHPAFTGTVVVE